MTAQLSGTYTIGANNNYSTYTTAVNTLTTSGISAQKWEISSKISPDIILISSKSEDFTKSKIGFGKKFSIRNLNFLAELKYSQDIADWSYQPKTDKDIDEIKFKTHILSLSIEIIFRNKAD